MCQRVNYWCLYPSGAGRDSVAGTATRYGLDGPGIESRWEGAIFSAPGAHPAFYTMGTGSFPGVKRPERGADHPTPSSAEVNERVELQFYYPFGLSYPVLEWTSSLLYFTASICSVWISIRRKNTVRKYPDFLKKLFTILAEDFRHCFQQWGQRCDSRIHTQGDYDTLKGTKVSNLYEYFK